MLTRVLVAWAIAAISAAQTPSTEPDIAILANVRAKELRFDVVPDVKVTFPDQQNNKTVWHSARPILPEHVQPQDI